MYFAYFSSLSTIRLKNLVTHEYRQFKGTSKSLTISQYRQPYEINHLVVVTCSKLIGYQNGYRRESCEYQRQNIPIFRLGSDDSLKLETLLSFSGFMLTTTISMKHRRQASKISDGTIENSNSFPITA